MFLLDGTLETLATKPQSTSFPTTNHTFPQALFNDTTGTASPFTLHLPAFQVPERAADRIDPDTLQMTSAAADSEDPQEVTSVSLEGWESSLWMVKDVVITWFAGWFWF